MKTSKIKYLAQALSTVETVIEKRSDFSEYENLIITALINVITEDIYHEARYNSDNSKDDIEASITWWLIEKTKGDKFIYNIAGKVSKDVNKAADFIRYFL